MISSKPPSDAEGLNVDVIQTGPSGFQVIRWRRDRVIAVGPIRDTEAEAKQAFRWMCGDRPQHLTCP